jgi:hypothetical protein
MPPAILALTLAACGSHSALSVGDICVHADPPLSDDNPFVVTIMCGVEGSTGLDCADTRQVKLDVSNPSIGYGESCGSRTGFTLTVLRHHPIVDECLPDEQAAEIFGVHLCLRDRE